MVSYMKGHLIDRGSCWEVYQCLDPQTGQLYAMKTLRLHGMQNSGVEKSQTKQILSPSVLEHLRNEISMFGRFSHQNIVRYISLDSSNLRRLNIILEFVSGGSIRVMLEKFGAFNEKVISVYMRQILNGLEYLHEQGVCHRDIKGGNILIDTDGTIKLTGFGSLNSLLLSSVPPYWTAPEVLGHPELTFSKSADIWSLGCLVIEMLTATPPYSTVFPTKSPSYLASHIVNGNLPEFPATLSASCQEFLNRTLQIDPTERATLEELKNLPFIKDPESLENAGESPVSGSLQKSNRDIDFKQIMNRISQRKLTKHQQQSQVQGSSSQFLQPSRNLDSGNLVQVRDLYQSSLISQLKEENAAANFLSMPIANSPLSRQSDQRDVENEILALIRKKKLERNQMKNESIFKNTKIERVASLDLIAKPTPNSKIIKVVFNNPNDQFTPIDQAEIFEHNSHLLNQQYNDLEGMLPQLNEQITRSFRILSMKHLESSRIDEAEEREEQEIDTDRNRKEDTIRSSLLRTRGRSAMQQERKPILKRGGSLSSNGNSHKTGSQGQGPILARENTVESQLSQSIKPFLISSIPSMNSYNGIDRLQGSQEIQLFQGGIDFKRSLQKRDGSSNKDRPASFRKMSHRITTMTTANLKIASVVVDAEKIMKKATFNTTGETNYLQKARDIKEFVRDRKEIPKYKQSDSKQISLFPDIVPNVTTIRQNRLKPVQPLFKIDAFNHQGTVS